MFRNKPAQKKARTRSVLIPTPNRFRVGRRGLGGGVGCGVEDGRGWGRGWGVGGGEWLNTTIPEISLTSNEFCHSFVALTRIL